MTRKRLKLGREPGVLPPPTREERALAKHLQHEMARSAKRAAATAREEESVAHTRAIKEAKASLRDAQARLQAARADVARLRALLAAETKLSRRRRA